MYKVFVAPSSCNIGDILADDIIDKNGYTLLTKNTVINNFIKNKLIELNIQSICLYNYEKSGSSSQNNSIDNAIIDETYRDSILALKKVLNNLSTCDNIDYNNIKYVSCTLMEVLNMSSCLIDYIKQIKDFDEYTYTHSINVALYSMLIASWLGLPKYQIQEVIQAGLLHDIGKLKIPENILNKNGKLNSEEYNIIKNHCEYGYDLIKDNPNISENIKRAVLLHHEKIDGSGYPFGVSGDSISFLAKIISIADVYDAMTQNRIYKKKQTPFDAFEMFFSDGLSKFDTNITNTFLTNLAPFYLDSSVVLNTGDIGEIVYIPPYNIANPIVKINSTYIDFAKKSNLKLLNLV